MKQRWIGFSGFPACYKISESKSSGNVMSVAEADTDDRAEHQFHLLTAPARRPASEGVAVDNQDSYCDNEDEPGINA
jgi:hypothetical protein